MKKALLYFLLGISLNVSSQQRKIKILKSEISYTDEDTYPGATILLGKVKMSHAGAILNCHRAFYYKDDNFFKAIGKVRINQGDTIHQTSDYVDYDANSKQAISWGNVILKDPKMTLTTDTLYFNREQQQLFYQDHATIKDKTNTLKSKNGNYNLESKKFTATTRVNITNPDNVITSNHLDYFTFIE